MKNLPDKELLEVNYSALDLDDEFIEIVKEEIEICNLTQFLKNTMLNR